MAKTPETYIDRQEDELPDDAVAAMRQYIEDADQDDSTIYDNLSRIKQLYVRDLVPDGFDLGEPSIEDLDHIFTAIDAEDVSADTKFSYRKAIKAFYREYRKSELSRVERIQQMQDQDLPVPGLNGLEDVGPQYQKVMYFSATSGQGSSVKVEPWMITAPDETKDIINRAPTRERAFYWIEYSCAATSGEVYQLYVHDIDLDDESIYIRGNKQHQSSRMELLNEALAAVREWLDQHPAVEDPYDTENVRDDEGNPVPLWVKKRATTCTRCDAPKTHHTDDTMDTCEGYEAKPWEQVTKRPFFETWRDVVAASDVTRLEEQDGTTVTEEDLKMKHLRKSMLTRFAAEIDEGVKQEQLREFARWQPGEGSPEHYIALSESISRNLVQRSFKGQPDGSGEEVVCAVCETRNPPGSIRCQRCHRSLDAPGSAKRDNVEALADKIGDIDTELLEQALEEADRRSETEHLEARIEKLEQQLQDQPT